MKKLLLIVVLLTITLTFTFAQASVGGWGRGVFVPVAMADNDPQSVVMASWGPWGMRTGFTVSGSSDNVGMVIDITADNGGVGAGDQQKIWVKPHEMITLAVGRIFDDTLRGSGPFCMYNWVRLGSMNGDDLVFGRVGVKGQANAEIAIAPAPGAYIYAAFGASDPYGWDPFNIQSVVNLMDMLAYGQYGAGYDIAGIGMIRAQYLGIADVANAGAGAHGVIQAAFKVTAVEGLIADIGVHYNYDPDENVDATINIPLYVMYTMNTLTLHVAANFQLAEVADPSYKVGLGVEYGLSAGPTIQGDVRYQSDGATNVFGAGAFAKFSYSNGIFGIGAEVTNGNFAGGIVTKTDSEAITFCIPIRLEYWF